MVDRAVVEFRNVLRLDANHRTPASCSPGSRWTATIPATHTGATLRPVGRSSPPKCIEGRIAPSPRLSPPSAQSWEGGGNAMGAGCAPFELAPDVLDRAGGLTPFFCDYRPVALLDRDDCGRGPRSFPAREGAGSRTSRQRHPAQHSRRGRNWQGRPRWRMSRSMPPSSSTRVQAAALSKLSILAATGDEPAIEAHLREWPPGFPATRTSRLRSSAFS